MSRKERWAILMCDNFTFFAYDDRTPTESKEKDCQCGLVKETEERILSMKSNWYSKKRLFIFKHTRAATTTVLSTAVVIISLAFASSYALGGQGDAKRLLFTVYTTNDDPETRAVLKKYYVSKSQQDYVIDDTRNKKIFSDFPQFKKILIGTSLSELSNVKIEQARNNSFTQNDIIVYDIERWKSTPLYEQDNAADSISNASKIVHEAGYKFGTTPDQKLLSKWYNKTDWDQVDFVGLQLQNLSDDVPTFTKNVAEISNHIRSINPDIEIFVQLSFRHSNVQEMQQAIDGVKRYVNGVIIAYLPNSAEFPCANCSTESLDKILDFITTTNNTAK